MSWGAAFGGLLQGAGAGMAHVGKKEMDNDFEREKEAVRAMREKSMAEFTNKMAQERQDKQNEFIKDRDMSDKVFRANENEAARRAQEEKDSANRLTALADQKAAEGNVARTITIIRDGKEIEVMLDKQGNEVNRLEKGAAAPKPVSLTPEQERRNKLFDSTLSEYNKLEAKLVDLQSKTIDQYGNQIDNSAALTAVQPQLEALKQRLKDIDPEQANQMFGVNREKATSAAQLKKMQETYPAIADQLPSLMTKFSKGLNEQDIKLLIEDYNSADSPEKAQTFALIKSMSPELYDIIVKGANAGGSEQTAIKEEKAPPASGYHNKVDVEGNPTHENAGSFWKGLLNKDEPSSADQGVLARLEERLEKAKSPAEKNMIQQQINSLKGNKGLL